MALGLKVMMMYRLTGNYHVFFKFTVVKTGKSDAGMYNSELASTLITTLSYRLTRKEDKLYIYAFFKNVDLLRTGVVQSIVKHFFMKRQYY